MDAWLEIGLSNALVASALALFACVATRICRRPQLAYGLWLLVLAKLVMPPLWSLTWYPPPLAALISPSVPAFTAPTCQAIEDAAAHPTPDEAPSGHAVSAEDASIRPGISAIASLNRDVRWPWIAIFRCTWLAGSALWFVLAAVRIVRFGHVLRNAQPAQADLCDEVCGLANRLGLRRVPAVRLVNRRLPPLVWAMAGQATILLPAGLLARLSADERATLFAHELAHLRRRDHLVRWLELVALGLYWWHPVAWWARRKIEQANEHCCDARVVALLPKSTRAYAMALLTTVDFLAETEATLPLAANGFSQARYLTRRLEMILAPTTSRSRNWLLPGAMLVAGLLVLPVSIHAFSAEPDSGESPAGGADDPVAPITSRSARDGSLAERIDRLEAMVRRLRDELGRSARPPRSADGTHEPVAVSTHSEAPTPASGENKPGNFKAEAERSLAEMIGKADAKLEAARTQLARQSAADRQYQAVLAAFDSDTVTIDQVLESQRRLQDARVSFARTACDLCDDLRQRDTVFAAASLSAANEALAEARQTWRRVHDKQPASPSAKEAADEAQAREQYFQFKSAAEKMLNRYQHVNSKSTDWDPR